MSINRMVYTGTSYFGEHAREEIATEIKKRGFKKVLLVSDETLKVCGVVEKIEEVLKKNDIEFSVFFDIKPNPTIENVHSGLEALEKAQSDVIVAVGGGSVIDTAKAIAVVVNNPQNRDIVSLEGVDKSTNPAMPIIAVPTTAGTGSETTMDYVITNVQEKRKMACMDSLVVPVVAILDTDIMASLPLKMTAATAMDALTHAVESFISLGSFEFSKMLSLEAVKLIASDLQKVINDLSDLEARKNIAMAQFMAGMSFTNVGLGIVHSMAHPLSAFYDVPHGIANALILPYIVEFNASACKEDMLLLAQAFDSEFDKSEGWKAATKVCVDAINRLNESAGLPRTLSEVGALFEDIDDLSASALSDAATPDNPREVSIDDFKSLYKKMFN